MKQWLVATKQTIIPFIFIILGFCNKTGQITEPPSPKQSCAECHFTSKIFSSLPANIRIKLDPLAETMSKGLQSVDIHNPVESPEILSAETCAKCHQESYTSWKKSHHGQSWVDPLFKVALRKEPMQWCINCHSPLKEQQSGNKVTGQLNPGLMEEGINCAVCHIRNGIIYASPLKKGNQSAIAKMDTRAKECILPIKRSASLIDGSLCAGCHQFNFPDSLGSLESTKSLRLGDTPMQNTVAEYGNSEAHAKGISCSECHFRAQNKPTHDTQTGTQNSFHISFTKVKNPETGRPYMEANLQMKNIGHAWPTGDLFRSVTIESLDSSGRRMDTVVIARQYDMSDKKMINDTTMHEEKNKSNDQTAKKTFILYYDYNPERCRVTYRSQGLIEGILLRDFSLEELSRKYQRILYTDKCIK